jgi:hypothetical protein
MYNLVLVPTIALGQTPQKTLLAAVLLLLHVHIHCKETYLLSCCIATGISQYFDVIMKKGGNDVVAVPQFITIVWLLALLLSEE